MSATACGCTADAELNAGGVCPSCGHRDHGRSGCRTTSEEARSRAARDIDKPADAWLLFFEDPDHVIETFVGAGAEEGAWRRYRDASRTWNCTLFRAVSPDIDRHTAHRDAKP